MGRTLLTWLFALPLYAAIVVNVPCGGPGDFGYSGGTVWTSANQPGIPLPLRFAVNLTYTLPVGPGAYVVKLTFLEPNKTAPRQRVFDVELNGRLVVADLDLYAIAGVLVTYSVSFPVQVESGGLIVHLAASAGNAVISGILVESVDVPASADGDWCEGGLGDGGGTMFSIFGALPPRHQAICMNARKTPRVITSVRCWTDGTSVNTLDVQLLDARGYRSLLAAPIVCTALPAPAVIVPVLDGPVQIPNTLLHFFVMLMVPQVGELSPTQVGWTVNFQ